MRSWAVGKILLVVAAMLALLVLVFDNLAWSDRCERMGGLVYRQHMFAGPQCLPNLNLEPRHDR